MMNKEMFGRIKTAAGFQRQAIRALLPEGMEGHLDVIEGEIKAMFAEAVTKVMADHVTGECKSDATEDKANTKVKKVTIE